MTRYPLPTRLSKPAAMITDNGYSVNLGALWVFASDKDLNGDIQIRITWRWTTRMRA
ncbi:hypothetical protein GCM10010912_50660 [Paenibacillus albidus]|uniref:Uncharacterized protein n=1 Tax=Paenibacillus albidus TaxID=2041023 RepID=A0A917FSJ3_9BACL|nr:hypothetical protein [Paenibacillus albidus]GGF99708.1 hypothetical protein GCM10010912_50660 [Paenibacillus albidus]